VLLANASGFAQVRQVAKSPTTLCASSMARRHQPPVSLPFMMRALYWTVLLMPLVLIAGIGYGLQHWLRGAAVSPWQVIATVVVCVAIASSFLFRLPGLIPFSLASMRAFYPELAYALRTSGVLGFGWQGTGRGRKTGSWPP
jgi:hypothetical protein